jgi:lipoyl(octanoyl) transferase
MKNQDSGLRTEGSTLLTPHSVHSPDGTTSHSTRLGSNTSQVAGYHPSVHIRSLGLVEYQPTWEAMKRYTAERTDHTRDEIWLVQHPPVYTQGLAGKPEHLLHGTDIPVVRIDRGGQITYHGPGQIVAYLLLDLRRWKINVRELVRLMEQAVIAVLAGYGVAAHGREDAPGVYVDVNLEKSSRAVGVQGARSTAPETYQIDRRGGEHRATQQSDRAADLSGFTQDAKIAALGLKIRNGCCYHGLAFNVDMDLAPFAHINPCGYAGLRVTQACEQGITTSINELQAELAQNLVHGLQRHFEAGSNRDRMRNKPDC